MSDAIRVPIDVTNPGQFFACCGLLEIAGRRWREAQGYFENGWFVLNRCGSFSELLSTIIEAEPIPADQDDAETSPLMLGSLMLRIDWWQDEAAGGKSFKTWAGRQKIVDIVRAMHATFAPASYTAESVLHSSAVLYDATERTKTIEPLYFDARRAAQAQSIDVGFSPDTHGMMMPVYAAVEYLCLIGLQRFRPCRRDDGAFCYLAWTVPLPRLAASAAVAGALRMPIGSSYAFSLLYRTKYLKGFLPATMIGDAP